MKSERLVSLMLMLQGRSPRSARELAKALEVSIRMIYRDVDTLCLSGIPVYAQRGSCGGIALCDGYRKAMAQFSTDELHALFVSASDPLADLGVTGHERALHKLKGALPELQRRAADKARERILLDHRKWYRSEQPAGVLALLRRAVWEDRIVRMTYRDRSGAASERDIEPLGLVAKAGVWYAIARSNGELRSFRAERIVNASETGASFVRAAGFDLEQYWQSTMSTMERSAEQPFEATVWIEDAALSMLGPYFPTEVLAPRIKEIGPSQLRDAVAARARAFLSMLDRHADDCAVGAGR